MQVQVLPGLFPTFFQQQVSIETNIWLIKQTTLLSQNSVHTMDEFNTNVDRVRKENTQLYHTKFYFYLDVHQAMSIR